MSLYRNEYKPDKCLSAAAGEHGTYPIVGIEKVILVVLVDFVIDQEGLDLNDNRVVLVLFHVRHIFVHVVIVILLIIANR